MAPLHDNQFTGKTDVSDPTFKLPIFWCSLGFFFIFLAFNATQSLATSLSKSLANACFGALYGVFAFACLLAPAIVDKLGPKLSMLIGGLPYVLMVFTYIHPMWATSLPAHILVGLGAPLIWTGSAVLISRYAKWSHLLTDKPMSDTANYLNGVFFSMFHFNGCTGLILASIIMTVIGKRANTPMFIILGICASVGLFIISTSSSGPSLSMLESLEARKQANNGVSTDISLPVRHAENLQQEESYQIDAIGQDSAGEEPLQATSSSTRANLAAVLHLMLTDSKMMAMTPIIFYNGFSLAFLFGDMSNGIVSALLGVNMIGFVMASYYFWNTIFTLVWTRIVSTRNRPILLLSVVLVHAILWGLLAIFPPVENFISSTASEGPAQIKVHQPLPIHYVLAFLYCLLFSLGDSTLQQQQQSILQTFFQSNPLHSDASMSAMKLIQSFGTSAMFLLGIWVTDSITKVYILIGCLCVAFACLAIVVMKWLPMDDNVLPDGELLSSAK